MVSIAPSAGRRDWVRSWGTITAFLDVQNASQRVNVEGRVYEDDYSGYQSTRGLPLFPSFGIAYSPAPEPVSGGRRSASW